jgi:signal transduction histidine kinase/ActR/RegA family two-component response regulator
VTTSSSVDMRLLTLPLTARDGALTARVLARAGIETTICTSVTEAIAGIREGAAALLIAEEAVTAHQPELRAVIAEQPSWSDLPVIVLTRPGAESLELAAFEWLGNVTLMDRPVRIAALVSVVRTALRARARQYDMRDELAERVRTQDALQLADARKDEFLATLGHELRNPLAPLLTALRMLKLSEQADPTIARIHAVMERQIGYLERLVDDLLEVSRITRGIVDVRREPVDLGFPLRAAVETSRSIIDQQQHTLVVEIPETPITVLGDSVRLTQIFANLLNNAAKYTDPGGQIHLRVSVEDGDAVVSVRDTGIGIDPTQLQSVFEMFTQVSRSNRRTQGGLGIGLTLVRSLVTLQGGAVEARSEGVGRGSTFIVRFPAIAAPEAAGVTPDEPLASLPLQRVLVVDDNSDAAEMLAALLGSLGATVATATSGAQAIRVAGQFAPEVVVLDIGMPGMDGYEVARRLRSSPQHATTRIIALTGWGQDEDVRRAREAGIDHHMVKPPDLDTLRDLIAGVPTPEAPGPRS